MMQINFGAASHDGLVQVVDTSWGTNGSVRVTVREFMGHDCWDISHERLTRKMRDIAKRSVVSTGKRISSKKVNEFVHYGCRNMTFEVSSHD